MKRVFQLFFYLLLIPIAYSMWALGKWEPAPNEIGVTESCRQHTKEPSKPFDCTVQLTDGKSAVVFNIIFEHDDVTLSNVNGREINLQAEVNKLKKNRKRYFYVSHK